ncbi:hypothetical protein ABKU80_14295 (plasmid) [Enterobacter mori]|uniref:hypothetical protein n=1 Tax=Enterobacter mori TaxID=539813 RepID=UPI0032AF8055
MKPENSPPGTRPDDIILCSPEHFTWWFTEVHDLTGYTETEVAALKARLTPTGYPCIPFYGEYGGSLPLTYIRVTQVRKWTDLLAPFVHHE